MKENREWNEREWIKKEMKPEIGMNKKTHEKWNRTLEEMIVHWDEMKAYKEWNEREGNVREQRMKLKTAMKETKKYRRWNDSQLRSKWKKENWVRKEIEQRKKSRTTEKEIKQWQKWKRTGK